MAISRLKVWIAEVLTFADLNAEFNNLINGALTLISPLTASLDAGSFDITALDELAFTDAVANASAAGRLRRNGVNPTWHNGTVAGRLFFAGGVDVPVADGGTGVSTLTGMVRGNGAAAMTAEVIPLIVANGGTGVSTFAVNGVLYGAAESAVLVTAQGAANSVLTANAGAPVFSATPTIAGLVTAAGFTGSGNVAITPAAVSGTPAQHGLFRENVVKGWLKCGFAGDINDSFNVASITDVGAGLITVTWDRDFANADYCVVATAFHSTALTVRIAKVSAQAVGTTDIQILNEVAGAADALNTYVLAIGDQ